MTRCAPCGAPPPGRPRWPRRCAPSPTAPPPSRPRGEVERRQRLARRGAPADLVDGAISRLRELGLVDDTAFARTWVEGRSRLSPRSRRLLHRELQAKGIDGEAAREALGPLDDE